MRIKTKLFNLDHTLNCGQTFGWEKKGEWYCDFIEDNLILIKQEGEELIVDSDIKKDLIFNIFRLDDDLKKIYSEISRDELMKGLTNKFSGLRIMRQEPFRCLISYVCSANSNIPNIRRMVNNLSRKFGKRIEFKEYSTYTFPSPKALSKTSLEELKECKLGFRAKYVSKISRMIANGKFNLLGLKDLDYQKSKDKLMRLPGVGEKIADCVLLFSFDKLEAFPVDVWIRRAITNHYFNDGKVHDRDIRKFAGKYFGKNAGYAQEYLYYNERNNLFRDVKN